MSDEKPYDPDNPNEDIVKTTKEEIAKFKEELMRKEYLFRNLFLFEFLGRSICFGIFFCWIYSFLWKILKISQKRIYEFDSNFESV